MADLGRKGGGGGGGVQVHSSGGHDMPGDFVESRNDEQELAAGTAAEMESHAFARESSLMGNCAIAPGRKFPWLVCWACTRDETTGLCDTSCICSNNARKKYATRCM